MGFGTKQGFPRVAPTEFGYQGEVVNWATVQEPALYGSFEEPVATIATTAEVTAT